MAVSNRSGYLPRIYDKVLSRKLQGKGAVLVEGPKWCGKTWTSERLAESIIYMSDPAMKDQYLMMADINPSYLLEGENPRLIDEWQLAPKLWDAVKFQVDQRNAEGLFILTGSSVPPEIQEEGENGAKNKVISHSGNGRVGFVKMRPMALFESQESNGAVSLAALFTSPAMISGTNPLGLKQLAFLTCRGGWPKATYFDGDLALDQAEDYFEVVVEDDISRVDGVKRDAQRARLLMRSLARNQGQQVSSGLLKADIKEHDSADISEKTVQDYLSALKRIFVIEDSLAWNPNIRSKTAIRTADTRYFTDPSIAAAALEIGPNDLINDLKTFGFLFETLCIRDLRTYAEPLNGKVYHYRDKSGLECDAVVHLRNGSYGLVEIKLGGQRLIDEGVQNLLKLKDRLNTDKMKEPAFLAVLTGTDPYAYRRPDGIYIIPIGCLKD